MVNGVAHPAARTLQPPDGRTDAARQAAPIPRNRSLVAVATVSPQTRSVGSTRRPRAAFIAQLIAAAQRLPQARARRRANPSEATQRYAAGLRASMGDRLVSRLT